jgi:predicted MPP superfamily phosphohydrolase
VKSIGEAALNFVQSRLDGVDSALLPGSAEFQVQGVTLKLPRLPRSFAGIRLAHISDIHMGGWMNGERLRRVADLILAENPDLLLITGDFFVGRDAGVMNRLTMDGLTAELSRLANCFPTFAVLGNHDYWTDAEKVRQILSCAGIMDLTNTVFTFKRGEGRLHICGVDDVWQGDARIDDVIARLSDDGAAILLAHEPDFADVSAATGRFDLQLSGHTHGGQIVLPFVGPPVLPYLGRKYPSGLYKVREMYQYTNRGIGAGRMPLRINCPPEITLFVLDSTFHDLQLSTMAGHADSQPAPLVDGQVELWHNPSNRKAVKRTSRSV